MSYLWKCLVIVSGVYLFFFLEYVMKMIVRFKEQSTCDDHSQKEMVSSAVAIINQITIDFILLRQVKVFSSVEDYNEQNVHCS